MYTRIRSAVIAMLLALLSGILMTTNTTAQTSDPVWEGEYYDNGVLNGSPTFTRTDSDIAFDWGMASPSDNIPDNGFSIRWSTDVFLEAGTYRFWVRADDNVSVTIDFRNTIIDTFATNEVDELISVDVQLSAGSHHIQVDYRDVVDQAFIYLDFANLANNPAGPDFSNRINPQPNGAWTAQYFNNANLAGMPITTRGEAQPGGFWSTGSPLPAVPSDNWSARWTANLNLDGGEYTFRTTADDGVRIYVDGILIIDEWHVASGVEYSVTRTLADGFHSVTVEYYEAAGRAFLDFSYNQVNPPVDTTAATVLVNTLNVRDAPSLVSGDILTRVNRNESYVATARSPQSQWVQINANGVTGWVSARYVDVPNLFDLPIPQSGVSDPQPTGFTVTASPFTVNIRTGPDTSFRDIGNLPVDATAQVIGRNSDSTWWQINYNDVVGWVSAQYALLESGANVTQIPVTR